MSAKKKAVKRKPRTWTRWMDASVELDLQTRMYVTEQNAKRYALDRNKVIRVRITEVL